MARTKQTERKQPKVKRRRADAHVPRTSWNCPWLHCGKAFLHRQGLSRHMFQKHGIRPGQFKKGHFQNEGRIISEFHSAGASSPLVREIVAGIPTMGTLVPGSESPETQAAVASILPMSDDILWYDDLRDVEPDSDIDNVIVINQSTLLDEPAAYAEGDTPDSPLSFDEIAEGTREQNEPVPGPSRRLSFRRVRVSDSGTGSLTQPVPKAHPPAARSVGKNFVKLRQLWEVGHEAASWPKSHSEISNIDLARALDNLPSISAKKGSNLVGRHFGIPVSQRMSLRQRASAMIEVEGLIFNKIRKLLPPSDSDLPAAMAFAEKVRELCEKANLRPTPVPFE